MGSPTAASSAIAIAAPIRIIATTWACARPCSGRPRSSISTASSGLYEPAWPVFVVEDHPETRSFVVAIDDQIGAPAAWQFNDPAALTARRQYVTAVVRQRL